MHEGSGSLTWRPLIVGDARPAADLLNTMETVDRIGENDNEADTRQELIDPYADLERGSLAVFDGDVMVGYLKTRYKPAAEEVHRVFLDGGVHPDYRRRGIGTALVGDAHFMVVGTLREYRNRGVASALMAHALRAAADRGYDRASLRVNSANPSRAFGIYEKAGFMAKARFVRWALAV